MKTSKVVSITPVASSSGTEPQLVAENRPSAVYLREVLQALGGPAAVGNDVTAAVQFNDQIEPLLRQLTRRYGFERLPATVGELFGMFEYLDSLDAASGVGMRPKEELSDWQAASFVVWRRKSPHLMPAIELYCAGAIDALRELHRNEDTLTLLGERYLQNQE